MDISLHVAEFAIKTGLVVLAVGILAILISSLVLKSKAAREAIQVDNVNRKLLEFEHALNHNILSPKALKAFVKRIKKQKSDKKDDEKKRVYVLNFEGDIKASAVDRLRDEVTAILTVIRPIDEVVAKVESPGGMVHTYGLAASQLLRIRDRGHALTISIDKVAASGGYMMACTGTKIIAAPFAIVGSIGVVAQVPNFNKLLKKHHVDYEEITSGEFKRTISILGEITPKGRQKFQEKMEITHQLFKDWVKTYRPTLQIEKVADGDHWYGSEALNLGLVDELITSDDYIFNMRNDAKIYRVEIQAKKTISDRLAENFSSATEKALLKVWTHLQNLTF
jgi:serine protease SohB